MVTLIKSGCGPTTGASVWHIFESQNKFSMQTKCGSDMPINQVLIVPVKEYTGGKRISMCSLYLINA